MTSEARRFQISDLKFEMNGEEKRGRGSSLQDVLPGFTLAGGASPAPTNSNRALQLLNLIEEWRGAVAWIQIRCNETPWED